MKTSFWKRQSTWAFILLAGLLVIIGGIYFGGGRSKIENYLSLKPGANNDSDTTTLVLTGFNLGFEKVSNPQGLPDGWFKWGYPSFDIKIDSLVKHSGKYSLRIESNVKKIANTRFGETEFGCPAFSIPAKYLGKTVTVKAFMKLEDVEKPIGLMLRIDDINSKLVAFDNMCQLGIIGTQDWKEYSVTVDLPPNAQTIYIGAINTGKGKLWIDDFQVLIGRKIIVKKDFNLGFEEGSYPNGIPVGWFRWGKPNYNIQLDSVVKHSGKYALRVESEGKLAAGDFGCPAHAIRAIYEGKNITVKAFIRTEGVEQPIGLMLRIDGGADNKTLQFDNMQQWNIMGTEEWKEYSVSLPLPEEAKTIYIGPILSGKGKLWADDFRVLIDDKDISEAKIKTTE